MKRQIGRLTKQKDFRRLKRQGSAGTARYLMVKAIRLPDETIRVAYIVSQRISKKAVVRNRLKRRLRAIMQGLVDQVTPGHAILIITRPGSDTLDYQTLESNLILALTRARVITPRP